MKVMSSKSFQKPILEQNARNNIVSDIKSAKIDPKSKIAFKSKTDITADIFYLRSTKFSTLKVMNLRNKFTS